MPIETVDNRISYTGSGTTGPFSFPYYFLSNGDLKVVKVTIADGTEEVLLLTTHYTVAGAGEEAGGEVTLVSSLSSSYKLVIFRDPPLTQTSSYPRNDPFPAETHEQIVDKLTMLEQRTRELALRSLHQPDGDIETIEALPAAIDRASAYLAFDAEGDPIASSGTSTGLVASSFIETVLDDTSASDVRTTLGLTGTNAVVCTVSGTANAIILTPPSGYSTTPENNTKYAFKATAFPTGNVTIQLSGDSAKNTYKPDTLHRLGAYDISIGRYYEFRYDSTLNSGAGGYVITSSGVSEREIISNDVGIQLRCSDSDPLEINMSYTRLGHGLWLYNPATGRMEFWQVGASSGILATHVNSCYIDGVPGQALVAGTLYWIYARVISNSLQLNFSTSAPSFGDPFGSVPITGWGSRAGDPADRLVGMVQSDGSGNILLSGGAGPNGVIATNLLSYYNRQRITMNAVVTGASTQTSFSATGITNGLLSACVLNDGEEPFGPTFSGSVSNDTGGGNTWIGISRNGAAPDVQCQIGQSNANYAMPFSITYPGGSPNVSNGRNTYQVVMKVTSGQTATLNSGCIFTGSFAL